MEKGNSSSKLAGDLAFPTFRQYRSAAIIILCTHTIAAVKQLLCRVGRYSFEMGTWLALLIRGACVSATMLAQASSAQAFAGLAALCYKSQASWCYLRHL